MGDSRAVSRRREATKAGLGVGGSADGGVGNRQVAGAVGDSSVWRLFRLVSMCLGHDLRRPCTADVS